MKGPCRRDFCKNRGECRKEEWGNGGRIHTHKRSNSKDQFFDPCYFMCEEDWRLRNFILDTVKELQDGWKIA
jgi:hypothetical protein